LFAPINTALINFGNLVGYINDENSKFMQRVNMSPELTKFISIIRSAIIVAMV